MAWYPDWLVALDAVAKGKPDATLSKRNAEDIIAELTRLKGQVKALMTPEAERTPADAGAVLAAAVSRLSR